MKGKKKEIKRIGFQPDDEEEEEFDEEEKSEEEEFEEEPTKEKVNNPKDEKVELRDVLINLDNRLKNVESALFRIKGML